MEFFDNYLNINDNKYINTFALFNRIKIISFYYSTLLGILI